MVNAAHQDFISNAIALKPTIRQYREELDSGARLPPELARQLNEAGLFQLALPRSMGGPESDPLTSFQVIEELSKVDGSVGWCAMLSSSCSLFAGWLKSDVGKAMFGQPPDFRMAGSIRPQGEALVVDGGYRLRGQWDYASGVHHANWLLCTCKLVDANGPLTNPDGTPQIRTLLAPAEAAVLHDTWSVVGLRATGSHDFELADLFVPEEHSYALFHPAHEQGPLYHPAVYLGGRVDAHSRQHPGDGPRRNGCLHRVGHRRGYHHVRHSSPGPPHGADQGGGGGGYDRQRESLRFRRRGRRLGRSVRGKSRSRP